MSTKLEFTANYIITKLELETDPKDMIKLLKKCNKEFNKQNPKATKGPNGFQYYYHTIAKFTDKVKEAKGLDKTHVARELWNKLEDEEKVKYNEKAEGWTKPTPVKAKINRKKCNAKTAKGNDCRNYALEGEDVCKSHLNKDTSSDSEKPEAKTCNGTNAKGEECKAKAKKGEDFCARHLKKDEEVEDEKNKNRPARKNKKVVEEEVEQDVEQDVESDNEQEVEQESDDENDIQTCTYVYKKANKSLGVVKGDICGNECEPCSDKCKKHNK